MESWRCGNLGGPNEDLEDILVEDFVDMGELSSQEDKVFSVRDETRTDSFRFNPLGLAKRFENSGKIWSSEYSS
jgi:hypothetical protein